MHDADAEIPHLEGDHIEAILEWLGEPSQEIVTKWLLERQFHVLPIRVGLLVSGTQSAFEAAFQIQLDTVVPPVELPVPEHLNKFVKSVTIPRPRDYA